MSTNNLTIENNQQTMTHNNETTKQNNETDSMKLLRLNEAGILNQSSHIQNQSSQRFTVPNMEAIRRPQTNTQYTDKIINQAIEKTLEN